MAKAVSGNETSDEILAAQLRARALIRKDNFERNFESANTALTLSGMPLSQGNISLKILQAFIANAYTLADICREYGDHSRQISVLLWLNRKLQSLIPESSDSLCRQLCRNNADIAQSRAQDLCQAQGNVTAIPAQVLQA